MPKTIERYFHYRRNHGLQPNLAWAFAVMDTNPANAWRVMRQVVERADHA